MSLEVSVSNECFEGRVQQLLNLGRSAASDDFIKAVHEFGTNFPLAGIKLDFSPKERPWQSAFGTDVPVTTALDTLEKVAEALSDTYSKTRHSTAPRALYMLSLQLMHEGLERLATHNETSAVKLGVDYMRLGLLASVLGLKAKEAVDQVNHDAVGFLIDYRLIDGATKRFLEYLKVSPSRKSISTLISSDDTGLEGLEVPPLK